MSIDHDAAAAAANLVLGHVRPVRDDLMRLATAYLDAMARLKAIEDAPVVAFLDDKGRLVRLEPTLDGGVVGEGQATPQSWTQIFAKPQKPT